METHIDVHILKEILDSLHISYSPTQLNSLATYCSLISKWNHQTNLTGAKSIEQFVQEPLHDGLTLLSVLTPSGTLVDIGSGGGLPGIPAAILCPNLAVTLVEPRGKRVTFLQHVNTTLKLEMNVIQTQDREMKQPQFDAAVAQAVFPPEKWMKRGIHLVKPGGAIYVLSSKDIDEGNIPARLSLEKRVQADRPKDTAPRYAFRLRLQMNT